MSGAIRHIVAVLTVTALAITPAAGVYEYATISGRVTDVTGQPIASVCVYAFGDPDDEEYGVGKTGEDGTYRFPVEAGTYRVNFSHCPAYYDHENRYLDEWYDNKPSFELADEVVVTSGEERSGIDATLEMGGSISGTVATDNGELLSDVCVTVEGSNGYGFARTWEGEYRVRGLWTGDYRVYFDPCEDYYWEYEDGYGDETVHSTYHEDGYPGSPWVSEWYDDKAIYREADLVPVVAGVETPGIDASLAYGGSIRGRVVTESGRGIRACIDVYAADGEYARFGLAASDGTYLVQGLRSGDYKVQFLDCEDDGHASEWYDDQPTIGRATLVPVTLGIETLNIDAVLAREPIEDVAVAIPSIESRPLRTDLGPFAPLGWNRVVTVEVSSVGDLDADDAAVAVWAETVTDSRWTEIAVEDLGNLEPGEVVTRSYEWNALGSLGDVRVWAFVCSRHDGNFRNNQTSVLHYSLVGGTGIGVGLVPERPYPTCADENGGY